MFKLIDPTTTRDITREIAPHGRLQVMPAAYYAGTTVAERALAGHKLGAYVLPTFELIEWLRARIRDRSAIEIGAGNGLIASALGIPATDNRMQERPDIRAIYEATRQPVVTYGDAVEEIDAVKAVEKYKPDVVVAAWVTHKYDAEDPTWGGNMYGVDERKVLSMCSEYVFIGTLSVHTRKPLWGTAEHEILQPDWLYSRASDERQDCIIIWKGGKRA